MRMGYGNVVSQSKSKGHLFKLLEFNKLEISENNQNRAPSSDFEHLIHKFMNAEGALDTSKEGSLQKGLKEELEDIQTQLEDPIVHIESNQAECQSLIMSVIRFVEDKSKELYRHCHKYGLIEQTQVALYARQQQKSSSSFPKPFFNEESPTSQQTIFQLFFKNPLSYKRQNL